MTTVTQLVREVQHIGPDGQPILVDPYNPYGEYTGQPHSTGTYGRNGSSSSSIGVAGLPGAAGQPQRFANYEHIAEGADYRTHSPAGYGRTANYADYEPYPHLAGPRGGPGGVVVGPPPDYAYQTAQPPGLYRDYPDMDPSNAGALAGGVPIYGDRPPTPPSPSEQSESPLPHHSRGLFFFSFHFPPYLIHFLSPKNFELPIAPPIGDGHSSPPSESHSGRFLSDIIDSTLETDLVVTRCDGTGIGSRWQKSPESLAGCPFPRQECFLVGWMHHPPPTSADSRGSPGLWHPQSLPRKWWRRVETGTERRGKRESMCLAKMMTRRPKEKRYEVQSGSVSWDLAKIKRTEKWEREERNR